MRCALNILLVNYLTDFSIFFIFSNNAKDFRKERSIQFFGLCGGVMVYFIINGFIFHYLVVVWLVRWVCVHEKKNIPQISMKMQEKFSSLKRFLWSLVYREQNKAGIKFSLKFFKFPFFIINLFNCQIYLFSPLMLIKLLFRGKFQRPPLAEVNLSLKSLVNVGMPPPIFFLD